jgi:hypothetical protein
MVARASTVHADQPVEGVQPRDSPFKPRHRQNGRGQSGPSGFGSSPTTTELCASIRIYPNLPESNRSCLKLPEVDKLKLCFLVIVHESEPKL